MAPADDESAVDSLPVALAGTAIVIALIVALAALGVKNALPSVEMASADRQANEAANDCRFLLSLAARDLDDPGSPPGATRVLQFSLPGGTEYLSFGYDPGGEDSQDGTIYYEVRGSRKALVVDERASFRAAEGGGTLLRSGSYRLQVEYARDALGHRYLLVSGAS